MRYLHMLRRPLASKLVMQGEFNSMFILKSGFGQRKRCEDKVAPFIVSLEPQRKVRWPKNLTFSCYESTFKECFY